MCGSLWFPVWRGVVGVANVVVLVAFLLLGHVLRGLARGLAADPTWGERVVDTVLPALGLAVLLAGVVFWDCRWLLGAGAVVAVALLVVCVRQPSTVSWSGAAFLLGWLVYCGLALARSAAAGG